MCVCARAYLDESRSQEGEAVFVCFTPLSLLSRLHLLTRFTLQCSCILQSPLFRIFVSAQKVVKVDGIYSHGVSYGP